MAYSRRECDSVEHSGRTGKSYQQHRGDDTDRFRRCVLELDSRLVRLEHRSEEYPDHTYSAWEWIFANLVHSAAIFKRRGGTQPTTLQIPLQNTAGRVYSGTASNNVMIRSGNMG